MSSRLNFYKRFQQLIRQTSDGTDTDRLPSQILNRFDFLARDDQVRQSNQRRSNKRRVPPRGHSRDRRIGSAIEKLNFIRAQRRQIDIGPAANDHMLTWMPYFSKIF